MRNSLSQSFYMNGVHRSMPDLSNVNQMEGKFSKIPSRFMQMYGSSQENDSDNTHRELVKPQKSRFQNLDLKRAESHGSNAIKTGEMNLYSVTNSQNEVDDNLNTEQSDYGGSQLISQIYKVQNPGLPPIPVNRFLK